MDINDLTVEHIIRKSVDRFVKKWHYSNSTRGLHVSHCFGLYSPDGKF